jgi:DNA repair exonuclease SbcCD ATPase subunit
LIAFVIEIMWSGLGGLANKAGEFLKNLDETLSDDDEQYSGDEQDRQTPITKHELVSDRNYEGQGSSDDLFSKPAAEVPAPAVPASAPPAAQGQMEKKHQGDEIKKLQGQLDELRTEREDLKSEVANQLKGFTSEMTHSIGSLAAVSGSGSMPPPPTNDDYTSLKLQLQQAEEKLVHMSKAATLHHQELEETISNLQDQVREHRTYGNDKADHANALKKELETVRDEAAHRLEEKAVGEALASQDLRELKDELEAQKDKWWAQNEVLTTTQKALDDYICEASSKDGELERQAEEFRALLAERDHEIRALQE